MTTQKQIEANRKNALGLFKALIVKKAEAKRLSMAHEVQAKCVHFDH